MMAAQEAAVAWEGVEDELDTRERLAKAIREDPHRDLVEKETRFMTVKGSDRVDVYTAEKTLMRQFARHPLFVLDWVELSTGERSTETVQADELPSDLGRRSVYSLSGSVPVGVMLFKGEARDNNHHSDVVSHHGLIDLKEVGDQ